MSDRRPLLFNPQRASTQELEATLVRDWSLLEQLEKDLLEDHRRGTPRHWQIIGPRGSGKSHFTELLARRMRDKHGWTTVRLPEEHYQVASVSELLEQILVRLTDKPSGYAHIVDRQIVEDSVLHDLYQRRKNNLAPILVIIENLGLLFERQLRSQRDQARLRQLLTDDPPFIVVATATSYIDATTNHSAPFYDFFHSIVLEDLSRAEVAELVEARARWDGNEELLKSFKQVRNQIAAIYHLSGGNPRLVVALYNVLRDGVTDELHTQLLQLLDEVTPYFQARINDVPPQAARILTEMAVAPGPALPAELARRCRMPTNQVTAQLKKLQEQRFVIPGGRPNLRSRYYEVKDRLFRIWLQMREDQSTRGKLRFLTEFFQRWYGGRWDELHQAAQKVAEAFWKDVESGDELRCTEHLRTLDYLSQAVANRRPDAVLLDSLAAVADREEDPPTLRARLNRLDSMYRSAGADDGREYIGYVVAEIADKLGERKRALAVLTELVDRGSKSDRIASALLDRLVEDKRYDEAWSRASRIIQEHPRLFRVREARAVAGIALGKTDESLAEAQDLISETKCPNCRQRVALRITRALSGVGEQDLAVPLFQTALENKVDPESPSLRALMRIAAGKTAQSSDFALAATLWDGLSKAPAWFLQVGICRLSHIKRDPVKALEFVCAVAQKMTGPLPQFAVDHLIDILGHLQATIDRDSSARLHLDRAVTLLEQRTEPRHLAVAFQRTVPALARTRPDLRLHLLNLYGQLRERGLLSEDISPYNEARNVIAAHDREKALMTLHPEVRDAVMLLLSSEGNNEGPLPPGDGREDGGRSAAASSTTPGVI